MERTMEQYIINGELRDSLIGLLILLQRSAESVYHKYSDSYTHRLILEDGRELKLPFLAEIQKDLENLDQVIETEEYEAKAEELLFIAKEMGLL